MFNKLPLLTIYDQVDYDRYRIRYWCPHTKKGKGLQVSYGRTKTKEQAYEAIQNKRDKIIEELTIIYDNIKNEKQVKVKK